MARRLATRAPSERPIKDAFFTPMALRKSTACCHIVLGLVIVIRFVGHAGTDHVEGDTIEMPRMRSDVGGEILQAARGTVQHDERRFGWVAGLNKARLEPAGVDPVLAERRRRGVRSRRFGRAAACHRFLQFLF